MELLAPAGNTESLTAALRCGADAVYIGGKNFSARQNAVNFDMEEMKNAARMCHRYGAGLHIAVNTMLTDVQIPDFTDEIKKYAELSPDAFIVQDPGAAYIIKNIAPDIPLHASTQMTVHSVGGALFAKELGFSRVVISREASEQMISEITALDIETEIFVHGALCMSVSGQCYMSAMIGSRSANRGLCAQSCRLPFSPCGNQNEHCLSLKDLSLADHIESIKKLGVTSLKIEGRMKRPEYVAAAVSAYRNAIDGIPYDADSLRAVFSRNGFTDGYFTGQRRKMFGMRDRDDVMSSASVLPDLRQLYKRERKISKLNFDIVIQENTPVKLSADDSDGFSCTVCGDVPEPALKKSVSENDISRQLSKLGDTIYSPGKITASVGENLSVPASSVNQLRRQAIEKIYDMRESRIPYRINRDFTAEKHSVFPDEGSPSLRIRAEKYERLAKADTENAEFIILPLNSILESPGILSGIRDKVIAEMPRFVFSREALLKDMKALKSYGFSHIMCTNAEHLYTGRKTGFTLHGDFGLNIANSQSAEVISRYGAEDITLSFELRMSQAEKINCSAGKGVIVYGRLPLMLTVNCPVKNSVGCGKCRHRITDRTGRIFRVMCTEGYTEVFNSDTVYLADKPETYRKMDFITLYFTDENEKETEKIIRDYTEGCSYAPSGITRGLYFRGIK